MSNKKNLLNEAQVRQFMKLASLQPLTPGFVHGLTEKAAFKKGQETEVGGKADESPTKGQEKEGGGKAYEEDLEEGHGRGANEYHEAGVHRGGGVKELGATEDELGAEDELADVEGEELEDVEGEEGVEGDVEAGGEPTLTVAQVVDAIENALQELLPDEEVEAEYVAGEEEVEVEEPGAEVEDVDVDLEGGDVEELEEGGLSPATMRVAGGGKIGGSPKPKGKREKAAAAEFAATAGTADPDAPESDASARMRARRGGGGGGGMKIGGLVPESQDKLVEQITKRVAARILKAALRKK
jgi:hypothetical protein